MSNFQLSQFHIYSYGVVAENKLTSSKKVYVRPEETFPITDGESTTVAVVEKGKGFDQSGAAYEEQTVSTEPIECEWLPFDGSGNRVTSPDVRRGERVVIYQFGNEQKYYWTTLGIDLKLRKLETVIYAFSGTTVESAEVNADNYYYIEISTHRKLVHFHTSQANGEPFGYDVQFDTGTGIFTLTDTVGNHIVLNSKETRLFFSNKNNTSLELVKNDLNVNVPGNTTVNTTSNTVVNSGGNTTIESKGVNTIKGIRNIMIGPLQLSVGDSADGEGNTITGSVHIDKATIDLLTVNSVIEAPGINGFARSIG